MPIGSRVAIRWNRRSDVRRDYTCDDPCRSTNGVANEIAADIAAFLNPPPWPIAGGPGAQ
jgi:hypothetical protein